MLHHEYTFDAYNGLHFQAEFWGRFFRCFGCNSEFPGGLRNGDVFNAVVLPPPFLAAATSSFMLSFQVSSVVAWGNDDDFRGAQFWKDVQQLDTKEELLKDAQNID